MGKAAICPAVVINRAVPGSGKTEMTHRVAKILREAGLIVGIHSTDDYFMRGNRYVYDGNKLDVYHQKNLENFVGDLRRRLDCVICDNTNLLPWQTEPYTGAAREHGYMVIFINYTPRELHKHVSVQKVTPDNPGAHDVPEDTIARLIEDFHIYNALLDKSSHIDDNLHFAYRWDSEHCLRVRTDRPTKHFDSDYVITVSPEEYHGAEREISASIIERVIPDNTDCEKNYRAASP